MLSPIKRNESVTLRQRLDQNLIAVYAKPILLHQLGFLLCLFALFPELGMHHFVLIIEVFGEAACGNVFDLALEHFADGVSHLLQDVQEEHELVLSLLSICHVFIELVNCDLQLLVFRENFAALIRLTL